MRTSLNEGSRDNALSMFLPLFQKRGIDINISQLKQALLNKFVSEAGMHSLSQGSNYYLLGVARYYFNGDLTTNKRLNLLYPQYQDNFNTEICTRLDALVNILRNAYIDTVGKQFEQPEDFGNLTIDKLLKKYNRKINDALGVTKPKKEIVKKEEPQVSTDYSCGKNYTYEILYSYADAQKYRSYTEPGAWCITYGQQHYNAYIKKLGIHYVIFRMNGYENVPRRKGQNWTSKKPQDEYGNSLIALLQSNKTGEPVYITSRWNHGSRSDNSLCEADHAYTKEEFLNVIGDSGEVLQRAFEQWKANKPEQDKKNSVDRKALNAEKLNALRTIKYAQMMINGGANLQDYIKNGRILDGKDPKANKYKGTYLVQINVGDKAYATLMDRKQMFYDVYLTSGEWFNMSSLTQGKSNTFFVLRNVENTYHYIFDRIHHKFLDIDGITKFKFITSKLTYTGYDDFDENYFIVGVSGNQLALVNAKTMKPVRTRNGNGWFEAIVTLTSGKISNTDYRSVDIPYSVENTLLRMIYDSASGEEYIFDTTNGQFVQTRNGEDGYTISRWQKPHIDGYIVYSKEHRDMWNTTKKLQNAQSGEWLKLGGYETFSDINVANNIVGYKGEGQQEAHYLDHGKPLILQGQELTTPSVAMMDSIGYTAISFSRANQEGNFWRDCVLYNPISHTFYHDNISGWHFSIYGRGKAYVPNTNLQEIYQIPSPQQAAEQMQNEKENVTKQFNDLTKRMQ